MSDAPNLSPDEIQKIAQILREARQGQAEPISNIAYQIALSPAQIRALEAGDLKPFYNQKYFLQAAERYADFLKISLPEIEVKEVVQSAPLETEKEITPVIEMPPVRPEAVSKKNYSRVAIAASIAGIAVAITAGLLLQGREEPRAPQEIAKTAEGEMREAPATASAPAPVSTPAVATAPPVKASAPAPVSMPALTTTPIAAKAPAQVVSTAAGVIHFNEATWLQIVASDGNKTNLRVNAGEKVNFTPGTTAAIVFGKPEGVRLEVDGRPINLQPFILAETPTRALVVLNKIR